MVLSSMQKLKWSHSSPETSIPLFRWKSKFLSLLFFHTIETENSMHLISCHIFLKILAKKRKTLNSLRMHPSRKFARKKTATSRRLWWRNSTCAIHKSRNFSGFQHESKFSATGKRETYRTDKTMATKMSSLEVNLCRMCEWRIQLFSHCKSLGATLSIQSLCRELKHFILSLKAVSSMATVHRITSCQSHCPLTNFKWFACIEFYFCLFSESFVNRKRTNFRTFSNSTEVWNCKRRDCFSVLSIEEKFEMIDTNKEELHFQGFIETCVIRTDKEI